MRGSIFHGCDASIAVTACFSNPSGPVLLVVGTLKFCGGSRLILLAVTDDRPRTTSSRRRLTWPLAGASCGYPRVLGPPPSPPLEERVGERRPTLRIRRKPRILQWTNPSLTLSPQAGRGKSPRKRGGGLIMHPPLAQTPESSCNHLPVWFTATWSILTSVIQ